MIRWGEYGQAFVGRICVGRVECDVPENWREQYPPIPLPAPTGDEDKDRWRASASRWRELERERFAKQETAPWSAYVITGADGEGDVLGPFATEAEAKAAMEAEIREAMTEAAQ